MGHAVVVSGTGSRDLGHSARLSVRQPALGAQPASTSDLETSPACFEMYTRARTQTHDQNGDASARWGGRPVSPPSGCDARGVL